MRVYVTEQHPGPLTHIIFASVHSEIDAEQVAAHVSVRDVGEARVAEELANRLCAKSPTLDRALLEDLIAQQVGRF